MRRVGLTEVPTKKNDNANVNLESFSRFQPKFSKPKETFIKSKKQNFWGNAKTGKVGQQVLLCKDYWDIYGL